MRAQDLCDLRARGIGQEQVGQEAGALRQRTGQLRPTVDRDDPRGVDEDARRGRDGDGPSAPELER